MFAIANGRKSLWQWDLNQRLTVAGDCTEVHYLDRGTSSTLTVEVKNGKADIPNILLQKAGRLIVYAYIIDAQDHHTKVCETFGIAPRPKPAEYVYTETEVKTWSDLQSQIGDLADLATDEKGNLVAAINEAAKSGGGAGAWYVTVTPDDDGNITADKTMAEIEAAYQAGYAVYCIFLYNVIFAQVPVIAPLTIHRANEQYIFCGVGSFDSKLYSFQFDLTEKGWTALQKEIPQGTIPEVVTSVSSTSTNAQVPSAKCVYDELQKRNLKQATSKVLGGVKADPATADDTQPVRIDDSGKLVTAAGSGDISLGLTSATVGQTIKVKKVDTDGRPTSWEAADMSGSGEVWENVTFNILESDPVSAATINLPSANITKACIKISLFGTLEKTKFGVMVFTGATTGGTFLSAEISDFYTAAQQIRTGAIVLEKKADFWQSIYNTFAISGERNITGALRLISYNSDYLYIKTSTSSETFYGTVTMDYVIGGSI